MNDPILPRKTLSRPLFFAYVVLAALLVAVLSGALSAVLLRSIDDLLAYFGEEDFAVIFSALDTADLEFPGAIPAVLALVFTFTVAAILRTGRKHGKTRLCIALAVPVGLVLFVVALLVSVLLTEVNDIRFGTVLVSLYENLDAFAGL